MSNFSAGEKTRGWIEILNASEEKARRQEYNIACLTQQCFFETIYSSQLCWFCESKWLMAWSWRKKKHQRWVRSDLTMFYAGLYGPVDVYMWPVQFKKFRPRGQCRYIMIQVSSHNGSSDIIQGGTKLTVKHPYLCSVLWYTSCYTTEYETTPFFKTCCFQRFDAVQRTVHSRYPLQIVTHGSRQECSSHSY